MYQNCCNIVGEVSLEHTGWLILDFSQSYILFFNLLWLKILIKGISTVATYINTYFYGLKLDTLFIKLFGMYTWFFTCNIFKLGVDYLNHNWFSNIRHIDFPCAHSSCAQVQ